MAVAKAKVLLLLGHDECFNWWYIGRKFFSVDSTILSV
jgi:hypothetical protein